MSDYAPDLSLKAVTAAHIRRVLAASRTLRDAARRLCIDESSLYRMGYRKAQRGIGVKPARVDGAPVSARMPVSSDAARAE